MSSSRELPSFFESSRAGEWAYEAEPGRVFEEAMAWRAQRSVAPAADDERQTTLLLVDLQRDFCLPRGRLFVGGRSGRGAVEDNRRLVSFLYRNLSSITDTICTLDSHLPNQIFFPSFWVDESGRPLEAHRIVRAEEVAAGRVTPRAELASWICSGDVEWLRRYAEHYCRELEREGRYALYLWPPHCLVGSAGHALVGVVEEARLFHAFARGARAGIEIKGLEVLTEHYSVLGPEVAQAHDGRPVGGRRSDLLDRLLSADRLVVAGQAASHCVKSTLEDLFAAIRRRDASLARRVYVLADCMSAVVVPAAEVGAEPLQDFTGEVEAMLERCREAGAHVVYSTDEMEAWDL